jgi:hypothetical protein
MRRLALRRCAAYSMPARIDRSSRDPGIAWSETTVALTCLLVGVAVYVLVREQPVAFLPDALHLPIAPQWLRDLAGSVPTFVHTAAFALLAASLFGDRRGAVIACASWTFIEIAFEIGQHAAVSGFVVAKLPSGFASLPAVDSTVAYFVRGMFDVRDLYAAVIGGGAALAFVLIRDRGEQE